MDKKPVIVICGPTASGKTALSVELAIALDGEVVSADSMQIYKGMDIATAKPTKEEMKGIPHHLMSCEEVNRSFSVAEYVAKAKKIIEDIHSRGKLPIITGGTGLYINSLIDNIKFDETSCCPELREKYLSEAREKGNSFLLEKLREVDPQTALELHENNLTRIIRALEVFEVSGVKMSEQKALSRLEGSPYITCMIGLTFNDRQKLYERINCRVDEMVKSGLVDECREVYDNEKLNTACQAIGYKELIPYFKGEKTLPECIDFLKQQTRRYAKRQLTWFRRDERISWIFLDDIISKKEIINKAKIIIENSSIV